MRLSYGVFVILSVSLYPGVTIAQHNPGRLTQLYRYVEETDSLISRSQKTFYLEKFLKDDHNYRETWRYSINGDKVVFFQVDYIIDSTEFTEVYYLKRGNLVCSEEYEKVNYTLFEDKLKYGSICYFESAMPTQVVTLGSSNHRHKPNFSGSDLALVRFSKRFSELKRHLPMLP